MKVINVRVTDKVQLMGIKEGDSILNANFPLKLAEGNYKSVIMNFEFSSSTWTEKELTKFATFKINEFKKVQVELETLNGYSNACYVPYDVFKENCKVEVGVYGIAKSGGNAEKIVSTEVIKMLVVDGSYNEKLREENDISSSNAEKLEERINELTILINDKADKKSIPVKVSDLENDEKFIKNTVDSLVNYYLKTETYTKDEVKNLINAIKTIQMEVVTELPTIGENNIIYLIARTNQETSNIYDEYIYVNSTWEKIGSTDVDLTNYALKSEVPTKTSDLQNDSGFITDYTETDPTVPSHVKSITQANIDSWSNKSEFSGNYANLSNKPSINNVILDGNKTLENLGITDFSNYIFLNDEKNVKIQELKNGINIMNSATGINLNICGSVILLTTNTIIIINKNDIEINYAILFGQKGENANIYFGRCATNGSTSYYKKAFKLKDLLPYTNNIEFSPTGDYNLVHKKYVDDIIKSKINGTFTLDGTTLNITTEV